MEQSRVVLVGTRLAPPVELMRWLFERDGIPYEERVHLPAFHAAVALRHGVSTELPLLITRKGPVGGLRDAVMGFDADCWADHRSGGRLFGEAGAERARSLELFDVFDRNLFRQAVRLYYDHMLRSPALVLPGAAQGAPRWQAVLARLLFPLWRWVMRRGMELHVHDEASSRAGVDLAFARAEREIADGRPFLAGARPGGIDIVFAALASPIVLPERHGAIVPRPDALPPALRAMVEHYRATAAGQLALRIYETRPVSRP
jgi:glutathione S-transferase